MSCSVVLIAGKWQLRAYRLCDGRNARANGSDHNGHSQVYDAKMWGKLGPTDPTTVVLAKSMRRRFGINSGQRSSDGGIPRGSSLQATRCGDGVDCRTTMALGHTTFILFLLE